LADRRDVGAVGHHVEAIAELGYVTQDARGFFVGTADHGRRRRQSRSTGAAVNRMSEPPQSCLADPLPVRRHDDSGLLWVQAADGL
jgi:hypothetical protein